MQRKQNKNIFISFVGINDAGKLIGKSDGAVMTALKSLKKFDEVYLLWNPTKTSEHNFYNIADHVKQEIIKRKWCNNVKLVMFECYDVTDHNEIYPKLLDFCKSLKPEDKKTFTACISSGTPAMQVCWILMAESGDFHVKLIRSNEPKYGKPLVTEIKLGTGLPRIIRLEEEVSTLRKINKDLLPFVKLIIEKGNVFIGDKLVPLSPVQFSYYRYFIERAKEGKEFQRFSGITAPNEFLLKIINFHEQSFPDSDTNRIALEKMVKDGLGLDIRTFRSNISKVNKEIAKHIQNKNISLYYEITTEGKRHSLYYGISLPGEKIVIK